MSTGERKNLLRRVTYLGAASFAAGGLYMLLNLSSRKASRLSRDGCYRTLAFRLNQKT